MDSQTKAVESKKKYLTTAASIVASAMLARTIVNDYLPKELRTIIFSAFHYGFDWFSTEHTIVIKEAEDLNSNELYDASSTYLQTRISSNIRRLRASKNKEKNSITLSLDEGEELIDDFQGVKYKWQLKIPKENHARNRVRNYDGNPTWNSSSDSEVRWFKVTFHKKYKDVTLDSYLPHILEKAKEIKAADRRLKLYMNYRDGWTPINLQHPATFETLAMEADLKKTVLDDLTRFIQRKEYYKKVGKAWKRGYLLFGPPGTGKSSLIGAMANYLNFDIYDLNLNEVRTNSGLKRLLVGMKNNSLLVIEDIDCSIDFKNRNKDKKNDSNKSHNDEISLSGLLNFIDGLWSSSGEERIIVFTTNYKKKLDHALLRPGRMDMHIHMGYCGPNSFRVLVSNYHAIDKHPMFEEIEGLLKEVKATPAEVAEQLMRSDNVDVALEGLIQLLPHILEKAKEIKAEDRRLKLYMNEYECWSPIDLQHPATFETLAMEADLKKTILEDLARFVKRKEYYKKIGKAWKRGYLLFGPPGTGKSSLIAAMANYLRFDIYDLDLKEVGMNSGLKKLLVGMTNKSLLVIEDIDCSVDLKNRDEDKENESNNSHDDKISLSGLLNFVDGLWSTSGEERIIVFTTNYKEKLDPALLRPGRMDMHIHMGYCGPNSFRVLVSNYHAIDEHPMFEEIDVLLKEVEATPAEVAEQLMRSDDVDVALEGLIQLLQGKRDEGQGNKGNREDDKDEKLVLVENKEEGLESSAGDHETEELIVVDENC